MNLKLRKIGNSLGVIIPKEYLEGYNEGQKIGIVITSGISKSYNRPLLEDKVVKQKSEEVITKDVNEIQ